ncbi:hypothetical protein [Herbiconiux liangxiaofengii]
MTPDAGAEAPAVETPPAPTVMPLTLLAPAGVTCEGDSCSF